MALINPIITGAQSPTTAGAITGSLDTSAMTGDFTIKVRVSALSSGKKATLALEDTAHGTPFSEAIQQWVQQLKGPYTKATDKVFSIHSRELPNIRFGATNTKLRFNLTAVDATPGLTVEAWLEQ
jgi:hypothetical protein